RCIHAAAGNPLLVALMESLAILERRARAVTTQYRDAREAAIRGHSRILRALRAHDAVAAGRAMQVHLSHAGAFLTTNSSQSIPQHSDRNRARRGPRQVIDGLATTDTKVTKDEA